MNRRGLLGALLAAPVIIRSPGLLMPVHPWSGIRYNEAGIAFIRDEVAKAIAQNMRPFHWSQVQVMVGEHIITLRNPQPVPLDYVRIAGTYTEGLT